MKVLRCNQNEVAKNWRDHIIEREKVNRARAGESLNHSFHYLSSLFGPEKPLPVATTLVEA